MYFQGKANGVGEKEQSSMTPRFLVCINGEMSGPSVEIEETAGGQVYGRRSRVQFFFFMFIHF